MLYEAVKLEMGACATHMQRYAACCAGTGTVSEHCRGLDGMRAGRRQRGNVAMLPRSGVEMMHERMTYTGLVIHAKMRSNGIAQKHVVGRFVVGC